jgi:hypothetical protein
MLAIGSRSAGGGAASAAVICSHTGAARSHAAPLGDGLVDSLPTARLLLLVNYRPEYQHGWGGKTYYRQLRLDAR